MSTTIIDWDQDVEISKEESYQSLQNALNRNQSFGLYFVRSSPIQTQTIIEDIKHDLPNKKIGVLPLMDEVDNLFNLIANLPNYQNLNVLFISGLELSLLRYEERESEGLFLSSQSAVYGGTWAGTPPILGHLNLSRERFREHFSFSIVFCLPEFALRYFIRRAPDFFDWRSGVYYFSTAHEMVNAESYNLFATDVKDIVKYESFTMQESLQKLTQIRAYLSEATDINVKSNLWHEKGLIHCALKEYQEGIDSFDKSLEIQPYKFEAWFNRGRALSLSFQYQNAVSSFEKVLEFQPDIEQVWAEKGYCLEQLQKYEEALACYEQTLRINPNSANYWYNKAVQLSNLKRAEEAILAYDKALSFDPNLFKAWYNRGNELDALERYEEAIISFKKSLELAPNIDKSWFNIGNALNSLGKYEEAITYYSQSLKNEPDNYKAWTNKGMILCDNLNRYEEAIYCFKKALKIKSNDPSIWYNKGVALGKLGNWQEAIDCYNKALDIEPYQIHALNNKGFALDLLGRYEDAILIYEKALKIAPNNAELLNNRGVSFYNLNRLEEALNSYEKALIIKPDYPEANKNFCVTLNRLNNRNKENIPFKLIFTSKSGDDETHYKMACAYALQENIDLALENLKQAINLNSKYLEMAKTDTNFDKICNNSLFQALITEKI